MSKPLNAELLTLFTADQQERKNHPPYNTPEYWALRERDEQRRGRVVEIIAAGDMKSAEDYYYGAMVLHHGGNVDQVWQAYTLARQSAKMGYRPARWLTAATYDRWLMYQSKPQKYGTQIVPDGKRHRVWDVDPTTSDEERAEWDVRPLHLQLVHANELTRTEPMPSMDRAPEWLKAAIKRWENEEKSS